MSLGTPLLAAYSTHLQPASGRKGKRNAMWLPMLKGTTVEPLASTFTRRDKAPFSTLHAIVICRGAGYQH